MPLQALRHARRAALLVPLGLLAACEIPSAAPIFQQTWVVPADSLSVGVAQILPANVVVNGAGTAFNVAMPAPVTFSTTLGAICGQPACQSGTTVSAPVPAFTTPGALGTTINFPAGVSGATVTGGTLSMSVANNLGFDALRPNGAVAPFGTVSVAITSGATTSTTTFSGTTQALPSGGVTVLQATLPTGVYTGSIVVSVSFNFPGGPTSSLNSANAFAVTSSVINLSVSQATVAVNADPVSTTPTSFDLAGIDFADMVESGGVILDIVNPFTASAALSVQISVPAQNGSPSALITKPLTIPATPTSSTTILLTKPELQSMLGKAGVTMSVTGTATGTGAGNTVSVTPSQRIIMRSKVQVVLNVGA